MIKFLFLGIFLIPFYLFSQGLYNNGANIVVASSANIIIKNGNFVNENNGQVDLDGKIYLTGDFTNNAANNVFTNVGTDGEVVFNGTTQAINAPIANYVNFEKVTINNGANVTLPAANGMTTNGTFTVNGTFTSETPSDETIGGSLITQPGDIAGSGTVNIKRYFKVANRWQYVAVPMTNQPSSLFTENTPSGNYNANLYTYDETYDAPTNPTDINYANFEDETYNFSQAWWNGQVQASQGSPVDLVAATGYITYNEGNITNTFTGTPDKLNNDASYSPNITFTSNDGNGDYYDGWNLIANPYQSAIDWDDPNWVRTNISNTVYLWDGDNGNYVYYNNGSPDDALAGNGQTLNSDNNARYIPPMQSFFVKATDANPAITIPSTARVHHSSQMYKNESPSDYDFDYIKFQVDYNGKKDQLLVRFIDNYDVSEAFDDKFDAYKSFAQTDGLPQIYTIIDIPQITPLAINSLPLNTDDEYEMIPLGIVAKYSGQYTFSAAEMKNKNFDQIYLVDNKEGMETCIDLNLTPEYETYIEQGENSDRFYLLFKKTFVNPNDIVKFADSNIQIYTNNKMLFVNLKNFNEGKTLVYNSIGQLVFETTSFKGLNEYDLSSLSQGSYVVKFFNNDNIITKTIILQ